MPRSNSLSRARPVVLALLAAAAWTSGCADEPAEPPQAGAPARASAATDPESASDTSAFTPLAGTRRPLVGTSEGAPAIAPSPAPSSAPTTAPPPGPSPWSMPLGAPVAEEAGRAKVLEPHHDYGRVFEGTQVPARFVVESTGDEPLTVVAVQTSCGCTQPKLWRAVADGERLPYEPGTPLERGERLEVDVAFDTRQRNGREDKPIFLYANVPGGRIELQLRGEVVPLLVVHPPELAFGEVLAGQRSELDFRVTSADGAPVRVDVQQDALPVGVEFELSPVQPEADGRSASWRGTARLGADATAGILRWPVRLVSDRTSSGPAGDVPLGGRVQVAVDLLAPIEVSPPHLSLGVIQPGALRSEHARLMLHDAALDVATLTTSVEAEFAGEPLAGAVRARIVPGAAPGEFAVELVVADLPQGRPGRVSGRVLIDAPGGAARGVLGFTGVVTAR